MPPAAASEQAIAPPRDNTPVSHSRQRRLLFSGISFLLVWLAGTLYLLSLGTPRLSRIGPVGEPLAEDLNVMEVFDSTVGAALLDTSLRLHCFGHTPHASGVIEDNGFNLGGNFTAWPGTGFVSCGMDGSITLYAAGGSVLWQRSIATDFDFDLKSQFVFAHCGMDSRLYVVSQGHCFIYDEAGRPMDHFFLSDELWMAEPLLITTDSRIHFITRVGEYWRASPPDHPAGEWLVEMLQAQPGNSLEFHAASQSGQPLALVVSNLERGPVLRWDGEQASGERIYSRGEWPTHHAVSAHGNILVDYLQSGDNRFLRADYASQSFTEIPGLRGPQGELRITAWPDSPLVLAHSRQFSKVLGFRLLLWLSGYYVPLADIARMHDAGILVYDEQAGHSLRYRLPSGSQLLSMPDRDGNFLVMEQYGDSRSVVHYRINWDERQPAAG